MNSYTIPTEKIQERLQFENPWWETATPASEMKELPKRLYFKQFYSLVADRSVKRAVIVVGPRRVGKTVMMHHAIDTLVAEKVAVARKVFYIGIDNPVYINLPLEELLQQCVLASGGDAPEDCFVFFDEIQYLRDWERHLKIMVDSYPKTKFVVTGSAAAALQAKSTESGAGRFTDFLLPPLTFQEFLHLQNLTHLLKPTEVLYGNQKQPFYSAVDIKQLNELFFQYINYGGYPEVIFADGIRANMSRFIRNDIIDKVLLRDLPALYGIKDVQELYRFFAHLAYHSGKEFSPEKLSKESGLDKGLLKRYLEYLESAFLIKVLHKVDEKASTFKRITAYKIYLTNPSLRTALFSPIVPTDDEAGNMVETAIIAQWMHRGNLNLRYARWKQGRSEGEVDLVNLDNLHQKPLWAIEIKWSNRYVGKPNELKSVLEFCSANNLSAAVVTTIDKEQQNRVNDIQLAYFPASVYAYVVGVNTLKQKED
ncbi:ATP-binding protein [Niabella hirudinis]|uniref:ATP-binding protein n=1 Tax=Niabella hirudinis TaxID=1285929 RepID=UPI003EBD214C